MLHLIVGEGNAGGQLWNFGEVRRGGHQQTLIIQAGGRG